MSVIRRISTKRFAVVLSWEYDQDIDDSWWDDETRRNIESGVWSVYCFKVSVRLDGREIAAEYLGNSVYENPASFAQEHFGSRSYFPDMVREATRHARQRLRDAPYIRNT